MSRAWWRTSSRVRQLRLFQTLDDRKLCPLIWKEITIALWNSLTPLCFQKIRLEMIIVSTFHHQKIPRTNSIYSRNGEVKIVYLFFQGNTSRRFLNLLLFYLPVFWLQISSTFFCWMSWPFPCARASLLIHSTLSSFIAWRGIGM